MKMRDGDRDEQGLREGMIQFEEEKRARRKSQLELE